MWGDGPLPRDGGREHHPERQGRDGYQQVDNALNTFVDDAADIAGDAADQAAEHKADRDAAQADEERNQRADDRAREQIPTDRVSAEERDIGFFVDAEKVQVQLEQAQDLVGFAANEEVNRILFVFLLGVNLAKGFGVEGALARVDVRLKSVFANAEVDDAGWRVLETLEARIGSVGRDEIGKDRHQVEGGQHRQTEPGEAMPPKAPPDQPSARQIFNRVGAVYYRERDPLSVLRKTSLIPVLGRDDRPLRQS